MKPNIIVVLIDALRAKNLSLFGYPNEFDQCIKKLAQESINFTNHFASANATYPSLTALFTGKYPINNGIVHTMPYTTPEEIDKLKKNIFWLPLYLKESGYETYLISLIRMWVKTGFDYMQEEKEKDTYRKANDKKIIKKIIKIMPDWAYVLIKKILKRDPKLNFPKPKETLDLAISKIKQAKKPFFMFLHFEDVHYPWATTPTPKVIGDKTKKLLNKEIKNISQRKYVQRRMFNTNTKNLEEVEAKYNNALKSVDSEIGRLHSFLKQEKLWDNTILILLADHGFSISEHGIYLNHTGLYDESIHVPLMMHIPGIDSRQITELVQNIDIAPTILELLKMEKQKIDGKSVLKLINKGTPLRNKIFSFDSSCKDRWCVRNKTKKKIFAKEKKCYACKSEHGEVIEEYNLERDPNELNNIANKEQKLENFNLRIDL